MAELEDGESILPHEQSFSEATKFVERNTSSFDQQQLLHLYGLYKQATVGPCNIPKPGIFSMQARAKWVAWDDMRQLDQDLAKKLYVEFIDKLKPAWNQNETSASTGSWVSVSLPKRVVETAQQSSLLDYIKEGNTQAVLTAIRTNKDEEKLNQLDDDGLGLIHWAADRGNVDILKCLLDTAGIDVNLQDIEGQTALHFAFSCGNVECIELLLAHHADHKIQDRNGLTCLEVALNEKIKTLLFLK